MNGEIKIFIQIWTAAIASLCYCYLIVSHIPTRGLLRLLFILPITCLFTILPLNLSSFHLGGPTIFYLVWLANFKLLLFAFDNGPLSSSPPNTPPKSLLHFISIALLPIKVKQEPPPQTGPNPKTNQHPPPQTGPKEKTHQIPSPILDSNPNPHLQFSKNLHKSALIGIKVLILGIVIRIYDYRQYLHPYVILALYCCHVYLGVELILALSTVPIRAVFGLELQPQFNEPYLATSLQDFWGRRWNLMVTSILRPSVYDPIRCFSTRTLGLGSKWAKVPAMLATFLVSGVMHEIIYFYFTRVSPTWEVTWFFAFHGICTAAEMVIKKAVDGKFRLHRAVSGPLTLAFIAITGNWWFFPQVIRNGVDLKVISEYSILVDFVKGKVPFQL